MDRSGIVKIIALGIIIKALLFAWAYIDAGLTPLSLMHGHDGHEYLQFAQIIGTGSLGELPEDVIRHDPGLPLLLALCWVITGKLMALPAIALLIQLAAWAAIVPLLANLCSQISRCHLPLLATATLGYPAILYYGQFNLTEPLFTALVLASIALATKQHYTLAFVIAGLSALIRSTGLLLVFSLLLAHPGLPGLLKNPRLALTLALYGAAGAAPWLISQIILNTYFSTNFSVYQPRFGLPLSGFQGIVDAGAVRAIYILGSVGIFIASTVALAGMAYRNGWRSHLLNIIASFTLVFLSFHLCLKTLYYIDRQVWTFDYQDRYLVPLWPIAMMAWNRWINWPVAAAAMAGSIAISAWWMKNYLAIAPL